MDGYLSEQITWFADPANWSGPGGVPTRVVEHLWYAAVASVAAVAAAVPVGLWVGHTRRGGELAVLLAGIGRAVPSFGIVILAWILAGFGYLPVFVALVALALPPLVTGAYLGVRGVDPDVRDAAEGMGLTGWQVLTRVELPVALPLVLAGVRTAVTQVVATATLAAFVGLGGLGRLIIDGQRQQSTPKVVAGGLLVAVLSLLTELTLAGVQRSLTSPGLRQDVDRLAVVTARTAAPAA